MDNHKLLRLNIIEKAIFLLGLISYVLISILREYRIIDPFDSFGRISRYLILAFIIYVVCLLVIKNSTQIIYIIQQHKIIFIHILTIFISMIFNMRYLEDYLSYMALIVFLLICILVFKKKFYNIIFLLYFLAAIFTVYMVFISKDVHVAATQRELFAFEFSRVTLGIEGIQFSSIASYMGIFAIMWFSSVKNIFFKLLGVALLFYLSITLGKVTIIISLVFTIIMLILFKLLKNKSKFILVVVSTISIFSSIFITKIILPFLGIAEYEADKIFNSRISLWSNYLENIFNSGLSNFLFGHGFFDDNLINNFLLFHPHNQYLGVMYIVGLLGLITYVLLWADALKVTFISNNKNKNYLELSLLIFILFIQIGDDYIFFTLEPLYLMIFLYIYVKNKTKIKEWILKDNRKSEKNTDLKGNVIYNTFN